MIAFFCFLIPSLLAEDLPETKHLRGGIFSWVNALSLQRKVWSSLSVPMISFNSGEISLSDFTKEFVGNQIDINLSQIIQDMIGSLFNETEEENYTEDTIQSTYKLSYKDFKESNNKFSKTNTKYYDDPDDDSNYPYYPDEEEEAKYYCDKDSYPNAYLISNMFDNSLDFNCESVNNIMGQFLSYIFIIVPIFIIFIIALIFYIVFCFGRCCCWRPKKRYGPNTVEIVFFAIITTYMTITICFSFTSSAYLLKIVNYIFKKGIQNDAENICKMVNPSIKNGMENVVDNLVPSISSIADETVNVIDLSLPQLMSILNSTQDNLTLLVNTMIELNEYGIKTQRTVTSKEDTFNTCAKQVEDDLNRKCSNLEGFKINLFNEFADFNQTASINDDLNAALSNISEVMNVSSFIEEGKSTIVDSINEIKDSVNKLSNVSVSSNCDLSEGFEFINDVPSSIVLAASAALFLLPVIMLITLLFHALVFWTKNCCSRCCSLCCCPCAFCALCQLLVGLMATLCCFGVIFINLFYSQGDDVLDTFIKEITDDERTIDFGNLNLSSVTNDVIGSFPLDRIKLQKIEFIKNFIDAKLDTPLTDIISLNQLPFNEIAEMIEKSLTNAASSTNLDSLIVDPIKEAINETNSALPDMNLTEIANIEAMQDNLTTFSETVDKCYDNCKNDYKNVNDSYNEFFSNFNKKISDYQQIRTNVDKVLTKVPDDISIYANDLFGGLLKTLGRTFASTFRLVVPSFNNFNVKWAIGAFNMVRVKFLYNFFASMVCMSITAHLYIIGMIAMTILLWFRRKGMAKEGSESNSEDEDGDDQPCSSQSSIQPQKRSASFGSKKTKIENSHGEDDENSHKTSKSRKSIFVFIRKQSVDNDYHDSDNSSLGSIDDNNDGSKGIDFENLTDRQDNQNNNNIDDNIVNAYNLPTVNGGLNDLMNQQNSTSKTSSDDSEEEDEEEVETSTRDINHDQQQIPFDIEPSNNEDQQQQIPIEDEMPANQENPFESLPADNLLANEDLSSDKQEDHVQELPPGLLQPVEKETEQPNDNPEEKAKILDELTPLPAEQEAEQIIPPEQQNDNPETEAEIPAELSTLPAEQETEQINPIEQQNDNPAEEANITEDLPLSQSVQEDNLSEKLSSNQEQLTEGEII